MIIIGWAFMHEVNISSPLSLARSFLTQKLMTYSRKNSNRGGGGLRIYFFAPLEFSFLYFAPGNSRQNKAQPLIPLGIPYLNPTLSGFFLE